MHDFSMKPLGVGGIIDRAFRIYRTHFWAMILLTLCMEGTVNLAIALIELGGNVLRTDSVLGNVMDGDSWRMLFLQQSYRQTTTFTLILFFLSLVFLAPLVYGGITFITMAVCHGDMDTAIGYFRRVKKLYWKLVGTTLAVGIMIVAWAFCAYLLAIGIAYVIPSYYLLLVYFWAVAVVVMTFVMLAYPIAIHESRYGFLWVGRAWTLLFGRFFKSVAVIGLTIVLTGILSRGLGYVTNLFPPLLSTAIDILITGILKPVSIVAAALLYLDTRIVKEAYDLEVRANMMGQVNISLNDGEQLHG